jgi:hypothetical protein
MAKESSDDMHMEYRWVNDAHHRSHCIPIPKAQWDTHKAELDDLYLRRGMCLDDLMNFMREKHGFAPK